MDCDAMSGIVTVILGLGFMVFVGFVLYLAGRQ